MRKFNQWLLRFGIILTSVCLVSYALNQYLFKTINPVIAPEHTRVSCGVSFSQFSLSDSIIPNFRNASMKGRSGLGVYLATKRIIENNPHVNTIICDASVLGLPAYRDYKFFLSFFAPSEFEGSYPLAGWNDFRAYPINYKYFFKNQMRNEWVPNWRYLKNLFHEKYGFFDFELPYVGSYSPHEGNLLEGSKRVFEKRLKQMQNLTGETAPMSEIDVHYTDSLVRYCAEQDVDLVFYCAPVHKDFQTIIPIEYHQKFKEGLDFLEAQEHVDVLDFSNFDFPDDYFYNVNHLNVKGAQIISRMIRDSLELFTHLKEGDEF